jgi:Endonuclease/Exonuclease/phosphatase family.
MKIVFWNINKNENLAVIQKLVEKTTPDLLFLAECPKDFALKIKRKIIPEIRPPYIPPNSKPKIRGFSISSNCQTNCIEVSNNRLIFYSIREGEMLLLLGTVHLIDKRNHNDFSQYRQACAIVSDVKKIESAWQKKTSDTILIGDFNMNPFDPGMVVGDAFNSVCSEQIAQKRPRKVNKEKYTYFYNPSWKIYAGVGNCVHGSYYYHSCKSGEFHWNNFDQVLLRPSILNKYHHTFEVLHDVLGFDLRDGNKTKGNKISDHYPIMLTIEEKKHV